jgi:5-methylcytosine-specific restriction endonuclease McrA
MTELTKEEKRKASKRKYYEKNKVLVIAKAKVWKAENQDKVKAGAKVYRDNNKEFLKSLRDAWTKNNLDKVNAKAKKYYDANTEKCRNRARDYRVNNLDKCKESMAKYRSSPNYKAIEHNHSSIKRTRLATGKLSKDIVGRLLKLQNGKCPCCGELLGNDYHLDHIFPLSKGGNNVDSNIQLLKSVCNLNKHAKHPVDFMQERGFLC